MSLDGSKKTVFVLGAGASKPYGFPLGNELNDQMLGRLRADANQLTRQMGFPQETINQLICVLEDKEYATFDQLLENKPRFRKLGAILIASSLLPQERASVISGTKDWYDTFFSYCRFGESVESLNSVVTFNYDRSLQYALKRKLVSLPDHKEAKGEQLRKEMHFLYPHGTLESESAFPYGEFGQHSNTNDYIIRSAAEFKIISDDLKSSDHYMRSRQCIQAADQIVFLGFGYARPTLENLFHETDLSGKSLYLSMFKVHHNDAGEVVDYFQKKNCENIETGKADETAKMFFNRILTDEVYLREY